MASYLVSSSRYRDEVRKSKKERERLDRERNGALFDCGWIKVKKLRNETDHEVSFYNPYNDKNGTIVPWDSNNTTCVGDLPYEDNSKGPYTITYYSEYYGSWVKLQICDVGHEWEASFTQNGVKTIQKLPKYDESSLHSEIEIYIFNIRDELEDEHRIYSGYKITEVYWGRILGLFQNDRVIDD